MNLSKKVTPKCCKSVQKNKTVFIDVMIDDDTYKVDETNLPHWAIYGTDKFGRIAVKVEFCPHCGEKLPSIVKRKNPPKKIVTINDGGYYCDTCNDRLMCCNCYPPAFRFEPDN